MKSLGLELFDRVRIINLADRRDRRSEMIRQLEGLGGFPPHVQFHEVFRPTEAGGFPSVGARGCFESHLAVLRSARDARVQNLLILEDDLDFTRDGRSRSHSLINDLFHSSWDFFYGAHLLDPSGQRALVQLPADTPVMTASFVGFGGVVLHPLIEFLEGVLRRPPGSPQFGPMHVDGAYTVFRMLYPEFVTFAAFPALGRQRSSRSDIAPANTLLDRWSGTRPLAGILRRTYNILRG